jgi:mRNA-degrading endonuclease toxin of MazEF toxin-antitoxin module
LRTARRIAGNPTNIVSSNRFNGSTINTVIVAFLTTGARRERDPGTIKIAARDTGLPKDSFANLTQITRWIAGCFTDKSAASPTL